MAKPIPFHPAATPATEELQRRVAQAPVEHAAAVLHAFETLQVLHDTKTLDFVRGLLGAGDEVLTQMVDVATSPQSTRAIRNLLILMNMLGSIDPDALERLAGIVMQRPAPQHAAPSIFSIGRRLFSRNARRALGTAVLVLENLGGAMGGENATRRR